MILIPYCASINEKYLVDFIISFLFKIDEINLLIILNLYMIYKRNYSFFTMTYFKKIIFIFKKLMELPDDKEKYLKNL